MAAHHGRDPEARRAPAGPPASPGPVPPSRSRRRRTAPPARSSCTLRIPKQRVIRPRGLKVYANCEVACKVRFKARIDTAPVKKGRRKKAAKR